MENLTDYNARIERRMVVALSRIAAVLKVAAKSFGSQRKFAEAIGKDESYTSKILSGRVSLTLRSICELEERLGIELLIASPDDVALYAQLRDIESQREAIIARIGIATSTAQQEGRG